MHTKQRYRPHPQDISLRVEALQNLRESETHARCFRKGRPNFYLHDMTLGRQSDFGRLFCAIYLKPTGALLPAHTLVRVETRTLFCFKLGDCQAKTRENRMYKWSRNVLEKKEPGEDELK